LTPRALFIGADGRLRTPWRILIFLIVATVCIQIIAIALGPARHAIDRMAGSNTFAATFVTAAGLLAAHAIMLRWIDRRDWAYVSLDAHAARPVVLARGWVLGALPILLPSLLLLSIGWFVERTSAQGSWWLAALHVSLLLFVAALTEELLSRGYLFAALREWLGWRWALALTSLGFGLLHLANPGSDARSVALVTLAGIFLGAVLVVTGSLYAAWMAHWAWNWIMAVALHASVSGVAFEAPDYRMVDAGPDWITGGVWGPEGGAGAAAGMFVGLAYLYWRKKTRDERLQG